MLLFVDFSFFFSSRRRHTRCALVTGVQTCALPISIADGIADTDPYTHQQGLPAARDAIAAFHKDRGTPNASPERVFIGNGVSELIDLRRATRSEERRVGKECVSTCRSRWSPYHYKKHQ